MIRANAGKDFFAALHIAGEAADDGEIERQYKRWFMKPLPGGPALGLPMSPQLLSLVRAMTVRPE